MSEIQSEKAKERIEYYSDDTDFIYPLTKERILEVVAIAERQAEERHARELQELRDKAVGAYKECCPFIGSTGNCTKGDTDCDWSRPRQWCEFILQFTEKLKQ